MSDIPSSSSSPTPSSLFPHEKIPTVHFDSEVEISIIHQRVLSLVQKGETSDSTSKSSLSPSSSSLSHSSPNFPSSLLLRSFGFHSLVEAQYGTYPLLLSVPHGGLPSPSSSSYLPNRTTGCFEPDVNTADLALSISNEIFLRTGRYPSIVWLRCERVKCDMNRGIRRATQDLMPNMLVWAQYHAFLHTAAMMLASYWNEYNPSPSSSSALSPSPFLFIDLHGQSHDSRCQLGYVINQKELKFKGEQFEQLRGKSSMKSIQMNGEGKGKGNEKNDKGNSHSEHDEKKQSASLENTLLEHLLRGSSSLGSLLSIHGFPCIPSPSHPFEPNDQFAYFNGGFNTVLYGQSDTRGNIIRGERKDVEDLQKMYANNEYTMGILEKIKKNLDFTLEDPLSIFRRLVSVQCESAFKGLRDSEENREKFAKSFFKSVSKFQEIHLGIQSLAKSHQKVWDLGMEKEKENGKGNQT